MRAAAPPPDLARRVAARESENERERANYAYRQTVTVEELDAHGARRGEYREERDIVFSPQGARTERFTATPSNTLKKLQLTEEDFRDIREVQPLLLTSEAAFLYETHFKGEETMDGVPCFVLQVRPRQILDGQRLFDGLIWVDRSDNSIVRSEGQAVPRIRTTKSENLFPHFTTLRTRIGGKFRFPAETYADDTLYFRNGPQRVRMIIRYSRYRRFTTDSKIIY